MDEEAKQEFLRLFALAKLITLAVFSGVLIYAAVAVLLDRSGFAALMAKGAQQGNIPLTAVFSVVLYVIGVGAVALSFLVKPFLLRRPLSNAEDSGLAGEALPPPIRALWRRYWTTQIVSTGIAESAAVFGLVLFLLSGNLAVAFPLFAVGGTGVLLHFPTRESLQRAFTAGH